jgi:hypothetical protein
VLSGFLGVTINIIKEKGVSKGVASEGVSNDRQVDLANSESISYILPV